MPIPGVPEPTGATGSADFWYGKGQVGYPFARDVKALAATPNQAAVSGISTVVGVSITHTFTSVNGGTLQVSPDSAITVSLPSLALVQYIGQFWYDISNPAANTAATLYRALRVNQQIQTVTQGLLYNVPNGKVFETVPTHEVFFCKVVENILIGPGTVTLDHGLFVNNAATALTGGNLQVTFFDRTWVAFAHLATI